MLEGNAGVTSLLILESVRLFPLLLFHIGWLP